MADKTLLDRLNALKPSGIALGGQTSPRAPATATPAPVTREDALAARLRTLRRGHDTQDTTRDVKAIAGEEAKASREAITRDEEKTSLSATSGTATDDQALDDLLLALAATDLGDEDAEAEDDGDDNGGDDLLPLPDVPKGLDEDSGDEDGDEDEDTEKKVAELLKDLGGPDARPPGGATGGGGHADDANDDSDGETVRRDMKDVLEQAQAEAKLHKGASPDDGLSDGGTQAPADTDDVLALPTVPTKLVDPPPPPTKDNPADDDDDAISARLAALRGLHGKAAGLGETDAFGLPSAPTFQPGAAKPKSWRGSASVRYTDADQQTWCIVCLEDADVRCLGCSDDDDDDDADATGGNNAYCHRCWRAMHVGPAAGFDERGHARVPLRR